MKLVLTFVAFSVILTACGSNDSNVLQTTDGRSDAKEIAETLGDEGASFALIDCEYRKTADDREGIRGSDSKLLADVCNLIEAGAVQKGREELEDLIARSQSSDPKDVAAPTPDWHPAAKLFVDAAREKNRSAAEDACEDFWFDESILGSSSPPRRATPVDPATARDVEAWVRLYLICDWGIRYGHWDEAADEAQAWLEED